MIMLSNLSLRNFDAWSGAKETKEAIIKNGKTEEFNSLMSELYPNGLTETEINDLLRFEKDWIFEILNIETE